MIHRLLCTLALFCVTPGFGGCGTEDDIDNGGHSMESIELRVTPGDIDQKSLTLDPTRGPMRVEFDQSEGLIDFSRVLVRGLDGQTFDLESRLGQVADIDLEDAVRLVFENEPTTVDGIGEVEQYQRTAEAESGYIIVNVYDENGNWIGWIIIYWEVK